MTTITRPTPNLQLAKAFVVMVAVFPIVSLGVIGLWGAFHLRGGLSALLMAPLQSIAAFFQYLPITYAMSGAVAVIAASAALGLHRWTAGRQWWLGVVAGLLAMAAAHLTGFGVEVRLRDHPELAAWIERGVPVAFLVAAWVSWLLARKLLAPAAMSPEESD